MLTGNSQHSIQDLCCVYWRHLVSLMSTLLALVFASQVWGSPCAEFRVPFPEVRIQGQFVRELLNEKVNPRLILFRELLQRHLTRSLYQFRQRGRASFSPPFLSKPGDGQAREFPLWLGEFLRGESHELSKLSNPDPLETLSMDALDLFWKDRHSAPLSAERVPLLNYLMNRNSALLRLKDQLPVGARKASMIEVLFFSWVQQELRIPQYRLPLESDALNFENYLIQRLENLKKLNEELDLLQRQLSSDTENLEGSFVLSEESKRSLENILNWASLETRGLQLVLQRPQGSRASHSPSRIVKN